MTVDVETLLPEIEPTETPPELPEAELNTEAPPDKEPQARAEDGKFKGKEEPKEPEAKKPEEKPAKPEHTIPLATHLEERKALKAELDAMRRELESLKNPPKPPEPAPEFEKDPKGYTDHKLNAALAELNKAREADKQQLEQATQTAQMSREQAERLAFSQQLQTAESAFVKENPDYYEALSHVRNIRAQQLKLMAPDMTDDQIGAQIGQEEMNLAMQLARSNRNPIATVYQLAAAYGYRKQEAPKGGDELKLPDVPGQKQLPPDQTLGSGGRGGDNPTADDDKDDFDQAWSELFGKRKAS